MTDAGSLQIVSTNLDTNYAVVGGRIINTVDMIMGEVKRRPEKVYQTAKIIQQLDSQSVQVTRYIWRLVNELEVQGDDLNMVASDKVLVDGQYGDRLYDKLLNYKRNVSALMAGYPMAAQLPLQLGEAGNAGLFSSSWSASHFHHSPKIASVILLKQLACDVRNTEAICLDRLAIDVMETDVDFERFTPVIMTDCHTVHVGEKFEAKIGIGAASSVYVPLIKVDGEKMMVQDGVGTYTTVAKAPGHYKVPVRITLIGRDTAGKDDFRDITGEIEYTVVR